MRRLAALIVVVGLIAAYLYTQVRMPVGLDLELQLGNPPPRQVVLVFTNKNGNIAGELRLDHPAHGARYKVRLRPGPYDVGVRLDPERTLTRSLLVDDSGTYTLDLR
jgi:hypothetical protein